MNPLKTASALALATGLSMVSLAASAAIITGTGTPSADSAFDDAINLSVTDFDDLTLPSSYPNELQVVYNGGPSSYSKDGITFRTLGTGSLGIRNFGTPAMRNTVQGTNYNIAETIRMDFAAPVDVVTMSITSINNSWTFSAFDSGDNLLESFGLNSSFNYFGFANTDISYVTLQSVGSDEILIDNITTADVPLPAPLALFGAGLVVLGRAARKAAGV